MQKDPESGPHLHEYLQEINLEVLSKYDNLSVGEASGITLEQEPDLVDDRRHELNEIFNFGALGARFRGYPNTDWTLPKLKAIYTKHAELLTKRRS